VSSSSPGVRREWMYAVACAAQRLAGRILVDSDRDFDIRRALIDSAPRPATAIERHVLEGLIAKAAHEMQQRWAHRDHVRPELASRAASLLGRSYAEPWTIPRLARALGTNRFSLTTEFYRAFGMGVHEYLVRVRVKAVDERLRDGCDKLETIAGDVGFRSRKTLYDAYRRVTGAALTASSRRKG
jgi:AraC-like DNA-binding protein